MSTNGDDYKCRAFGCRRKAVEMQAEIDRLRALLADADMDTRRLEWLALNPRGAAIAVNGEATPCIFWGVASSPENTLRQAIDAAIAAGGRA